MSRALTFCFLGLLGVFLFQKASQWESELESDLFVVTEHGEVVRAPSVDPGSAHEQRSLANTEAVQEEFERAMGVKQNTALPTRETLAENAIQMELEELERLFLRDGINRADLFDQLVNQSFGDDEAKIKLLDLFYLVVDDSPAWSSVAVAFKVVLESSHPDLARELLENAPTPTLEERFSEELARLDARENPVDYLDRLVSGDISTMGHKGIVVSDATVASLYKMEGLDAQERIWNIEDPQLRFELLRNLSFEARQNGELLLFADTVAAQASTFESEHAHNLITGVFSNIYSGNRDQAIDWATNLNLPENMHEQAMQNVGYHVGFEASDEYMESLIQNSADYPKTFVDSALNAWSQQRPESFGRAVANNPNSDALKDLASDSSRTTFVSEH